MKIIVIVGRILVVLGVIALVIPSFKYFTTERVANVGLFQIDISQPHTVVLNPIAGVIVIAVGVALLVLGNRQEHI
ncbi:MAG: hypothetical protein JNK57_06490 [Planctomycetaceae bacterium]|jgi:hypothetical protein|nr:hypothetical protein [Planctomycetaceae bacterium]